MVGRFTRACAPVGFLLSRLRLLTGGGSRPQNVSGGLRATAVGESMWTGGWDRGFFCIGIVFLLEVAPVGGHERESENGHGIADYWTWAQPVGSAVSAEAVSWSVPSDTGKARENRRHVGVSFQPSFIHKWNVETHSCDKGNRRQLSMRGL